MTARTIPTQALFRAGRLMPKRPVAVLFARADSIYFQLAAEVYDEARDALTYTGSLPVVAHPPCRAWSRLRHMAKPAPGEKELAFFAIDQVRRCGGVLEHPGHSFLWPTAKLPPPGETDAWGGWTLPVVQAWWGHRALKPTWLYIVGVSQRDVPRIPLCLAEPTHVVGQNSRHHYRHRPKRPAICKREREATPLPFALWLLELAAHASVKERAV